MYNDGDFALHQYLPYTLVPFYPLFNQRGGQQVEWNQADWEVGMDCDLFHTIPLLTDALLLSISKWKRVTKKFWTHSRGVCERLQFDTVATSDTC